MMVICGCNGGLAGNYPSVLSITTSMRVTATVLEVDVIIQLKGNTVGGVATD